MNLFLVKNLTSGTRFLVGFTKFKTHPLFLVRISPYQLSNTRLPVWRHVFRQDDTELLALTTSHVQRCLRGEETAPNMRIQLFLSNTWQQNKRQNIKQTCNVLFLQLPSTNRQRLRHHPGYWACAPARPWVSKACWPRRFGPAYGTPADTCRLAICRWWAGPIRRSRDCMIDISSWRWLGLLVLCIDWLKI